MKHLLHSTYIALGRMTATQDARGAIHSRGYDALGRVAWESDPATNGTWYAYDALGRRTAVTNTLGEVTHTAYDIEGRLTATWGNTYPVAYQYDAMGRMTAMATTRNGDLNCNLLSLLPLGVNLSDTSDPSYPSDLDTTRWLYHEPTGLLTNKLYADGKGTAYTYTPDGKLATRTWARGITTTYSYNTAQNLASISYWRNSVSAIPDPDTPNVSFTHDRLGRITSAIVDGVSTNLYTYDGYNLAAETQNGITITRATDTLGRNIGFSLGSNYTIEYGYDSYGRFSSVSSSVSSVNSVANYSYLANSDRISGYTAGNFTRTVSYEPYRSLITSVENRHASTVISQYDYTNDQLGRRTAIARSGVAIGDMPVRDAYGYNLRSEVTSARRSLVANPSQEIRGFSYDYEYDPIGNRISSTEYDPDNNPLVSSYTANELNQYEQRTIPGYAAVRGSATDTATVTVNGNPVWRLDDYFYGGDTADNSTTALMKELQIIAAHSNHYSAVTGSVFVAQTPEVFTYDGDGNLLSDGRWQYTWNGENRLIKAVELIAPTNRQPYLIEYAYDHQGRMVWKQIATASATAKTITYLWDDYNIIAENITDDYVTETTYNVWGLDLSGTLQGAGGVGGLLAVYSLLPLGEGQGEGGIALPCYDANGNITEYLTDSGTIAAHYEYSPFGEIVVQSGDSAPTFTHRFSTKPWCGMVALIEYEKRMFDPWLGRWLNRDPIKELDNSNLFVFLANRTGENTDLLGLCCSQEDIDNQAEAFSTVATKNTKKTIVMKPVEQYDPTTGRRYKKNIKMHPEFGGYICCDVKKGEAYGTQPVPGHIDWAEKNGFGYWASYMDYTEFNKCQPGDTIVAIYHSHPEESRFSEADLLNECIYMKAVDSDILWRHCNGITCYRKNKGDWVCE